MVYGTDAVIYVVYVTRSPATNKARGRLFFLRVSKGVKINNCPLKSKKTVLSLC